MNRSNGGLFNELVRLRKIETASGALMRSWTSDDVALDLDSDQLEMVQNIVGPQGHLSDSERARIYHRFRNHFIGNGLSIMAEAMGIKIK